MSIRLKGIIGKKHTRFEKKKQLNKDFPQGLESV